MDREYLNKAAVNRDRDTGLSLSLIERGVPASIAFTLQMFLGRGKTDTVNHGRALRSQLKEKLKKGMFEGVDVKEIGSAEDVLNYLGLPGDYLESVRSVMTAGKGYSHVARVGDRNYLVRTNARGHKVTRTKEL